MRPASQAERARGYGTFRVERQFRFWHLADMVTVFADVRF